MKRSNLILKFDYARLFVVIRYQHFTKLIYCRFFHGNFDRNIRKTRSVLNRIFKIESFERLMISQLIRVSGNNFDCFSFLFLEGWISVIQVSCNYPNRNANFKSRFSDIWLKSVLFLISHFTFTLISFKIYLNGKMQLN